MHVLSRKRLKEAGAQYPGLETALDVWYRIAKKARWSGLAEVRKVWASADAVGPFTIFNIKGNQYRLITEINYGTGRVFVRHVLTHAEYDRGRWKT
jgi:mRNA interferase HigB